jgi:hypothetical protein
MEYISGWETDNHDCNSGWCECREETYEESHEGSYDEAYNADTEECSPSEFEELGGMRNICDKTPEDVYIGYDDDAFHIYDENGDSLDHTPWEDLPTYAKILWVQHLIETKQRLLASPDIDNTIQMQMLSYINRLLREYNDMLIIILMESMNISQEPQEGMKGKEEESTDGYYIVQKDVQRDVQREIQNCIYDITASLESFSI